MLNLSLSTTFAWYKGREETRTRPLGFQREREESGQTMIVTRVDTRRTTPATANCDMVLVDAVRRVNLNLQCSPPSAHSGPSARVNAIFVNASAASRPTVKTSEGSDLQTNGTTRDAHRKYNLALHLENIHLVADSTSTSNH